MPRATREPLILPTQEGEAGCDECGRGCLFGPVVAGAVILPLEFPDEEWKAIRDSKKVSPKKREKLAAYIKQVAVAWGIGEASVEEINHVNIRQATYLAMHRALDQCANKTEISKILVDGDGFKPYVPLICTTEDLTEELAPIPDEEIKGGDDKILSIAAASIIAKVYRDKLIVDLVDSHPGWEVYDLKNNKGYYGGKPGTSKHQAALNQFGPTEYHRKTFKTVSRLLAAAD